MDRKILYGIDTTSLFKAYERFEEFRQHLTSEQEQAGAIQAFEFTYELAWKTMKRLLNGNGISVQGSRDTFRAAVVAGMIESAHRWFTFLELRNAASHTYDSENVADVLAIFDDFSHATRELIDYIIREIDREQQSLSSL